MSGNKFMLKFPSKSSFWFDENGQAAAPFELFVAVIIMAFVMIIGYQMLEVVKNEVCLSTVDREMTKFKEALEGTANWKKTSKILFMPDSSCFASKQTTTKLEIETNAKVCAARCGHATDECFIFIFSNPTVPNSFKAKCIEIPIYTNWEVGVTGPDLCDVSSEDGYTTIKPTDEGSIKMGSYILKNVSPIGETYPRVCVLYRAGSGTA